MRKYIITLVALIALVVSTGCTRNNGDIGYFFGNWRVEAISEDGTDIPLYNDETLLYTWAFQSHLLVINTILPHDSYKSARLTWTENPSDVLNIKLDHTDIDGSYNYTAPAAMHFGDGPVCTLIIKSHKGSNLVLSRTDASTGHEYTYYLKKMY